MSPIDLMTGPPAGTATEPPRAGDGRPVSGRRGRPGNVAADERVLSVVAGAVLGAAGLARRGRSGWLAAGLGAALVQRGVSGTCQAYRALGIDTARGRSTEDEVAARGIRIEQAFLIARPAADLYAFWRDFANLPLFMRHLEGVSVIDDRRSRWVAKVPAIAGGSLAWDAEITRDEPGSLIAWRSLPGSQVATMGEIAFAAAPGERGTEVRVRMDYVPPGGRLGHWFATALGSGARGLVRDDLRRFKQLMEVGEIPTTDGQPRGTCLGHGRRSAKPRDGSTRKQP